MANAAQDKRGNIRGDGENCFFCMEIWGFSSSGQGNTSYWERSGDIDGQIKSLHGKGLCCPSGLSEEDF